MTFVNKILGQFCMDWAEMLGVRCKRRRWVVWPQASASLVPGASQPGLNQALGGRRTPRSVTGKM